MITFSNGTAGSSTAGANITLTWVAHPGAPPEDGAAGVPAKRGPAPAAPPVAAMAAA